MYCGAGAVVGSRVGVAVGDGVSRVKVGDRVASCFFPLWESDGFGRSFFNAESAENAEREESLGCEDDCVWGAFSLLFFSVLSVFSV